MQNIITAFGIDLVTPESLFGYESDGILLDSSLEAPERTQEKVVLPDTSSILESSLQVRKKNLFFVLLTTHTKFELFIQRILNMF